MSAQIGMGEVKGVVVVVGCGLAGCMTAMLLARRGYTVEIFERNPDWRTKFKLEGDDLHRSNIKRSINLALSHRGRCALGRIGLEAEVLKFAVPMRGRAIHTSKNVLDPLGFQPYDAYDRKNCIYSVGRERLNNLLLEKLEEMPNVTVRFSHGLMHVDGEGVAHFCNGTGESLNTYNDYAKGTYQIKPRLIIGADGAYSTVREAMLRLQSTNFSRRYISHGYKELTIPADSSGGYALKNHEALHIWPRGSFMMIALPNPDKSFTATIFAPLHTEPAENNTSNIGLMDIKTRDDVKEYMSTHFPDALGAMPNYQEEFLENPTSPLVMVEVTPWNIKDKMVLLGDAAHAMVPFYGQGMNSAFEDCLYLDECIDKFKGDLSLAVPHFAESRAPAGRAIAQLSLGNYLEMRHHTGSSLFLLQKKLEGALNWAFPDYWIPLYKMVTFTRIPFDKVIKREDTQANILRRSFWLGAGASAGIVVWALNKLIRSSL